MARLEVEDQLPEAVAELSQHTATGARSGSRKSAEKIEFITVVSIIIIVVECAYMCAVCEYGCSVHAHSGAALWGAVYAYGSVGIWWCVVV